MVTRQGMPTILICTDTAVRGAIAINWKVKSLGADEWKLALSANERKEFSGVASKASMRLTDPNFQKTGVFSLFFLPEVEDSGYYSCLIKQQERNLKKKIILLAVLTGKKNQHVECEMPQAVKSTKPIFTQVVQFSIVCGKHCT